MRKLADKKVLVLGLGETGLSLARWLVAQGAHVCAADSRELPPALDTLRTQLPQIEIHCGAFRDELLNNIELIAISPGVPLADPFVARAVARGIPVVGDIELFAQQLATSDSKSKIIAITGANGKTTVTSMAGAMCRAAGLDTAVAGNISPAVLDAVLQRNGRQPDVWVLELSSFQLETTCSLNADAATVLNVSEDHLDRYVDMGAYAAAKARIFRGAGVQVLNRDDARSLGMALPGRKHLTFGLNEAPSGHDWGMERSGSNIWLMQGRQRVLNAHELQVAGLHNAANALAALALCRAIGLPLSPLLGALRAFKGLPHRVEPVAEINGVIYYDDSKGTNVGATVAALQGLGRPAVLIAGGDGKGQDFTPLNPVVAQHARAVVLIGRDADRVAAALENCGVPLVRARDMADAVRQGAALAQPGDAVLLSPACASFDMFRNYAHRAEVFVGAVRALQGVAA
ncbi:MAG: UDP-N-acetylmuramoyl-L-alanine--D-glutamate ligase [Betaproteobacteria bacterium]|nr:UDP-N-acetylmuramoyl-L-alanine--D-glutamate ligase [Betaproteobacteria bacterium]